MRNYPVSFRTGLQVDMPLLVGVVAIATAGVVNLYSATSAYIGAGTRSGLADIYVSQIYWIVVGVLLAILLSVIDYRVLERFTVVFYLGGLLLLGLVFVLATDIRGSSRWIEIGNFTFQPSEFMKVTLILQLAKFLHNDPKTEARTLIDLLQPAMWVLAPVAAVMAQPDLGTSVIYLLTAATILSITKIHPRTLLGVGITVPLIAIGAWNYVMKDYQKARVTSFLNPEADKTGTGWHALQSQTAIGNGELFGEGFMQGTQNQFGYLPDQHSDFPFAVFAEDWGFVGCVVLLSVYCFLCIWAIHVASQAKDRFGAAIAIGVGAVFFWHTICNVGMSMGVLPVVGITLPLFSYGGSSMLTMFACMGLLMSVSMRR